MPSVFIKTYGCQMNVRDSEAAAAQFRARGFRLVGSPEAADVILLNTCSVRETAERKALGRMRALAAEARRSRSGAVLGFLGCMAQSRGEELMRQIPEVRLVLGPQKLHRAAECAAALLAGRAERICDVGEEPGSERRIREHLLDGPRRPVTAFVSIMQGCNQRCSFCIVPATRGRERSRTIEDILQECRELAAAGVKEIVFLGQIVTSYGRGLIPPREGKSPFVQLLEAAHEVEGIERIRFTSPHPRGYGDDLVAAYGRLPKLCEHAHLPVQSGSNRVLRLMRRGHTRERFLELTEKLRAVRPRIGLSTDLIVGFPGETEEDFEQTVDLVRRARFDSAFVFKFSPRRGTPAAESPDQVAREVVEARHARLLQAVNETASEQYRRMEGRTVEVLVEGPSRKNPDRLEGRTRCNKIVVFEGGADLIGALVPVRIERATAVTLYGKPLLREPAQPALDRSL